MDPIRVLLAVEPPTLRERVKDLIRRAPDVEVVGEVTDPVDLLLAVRQTRADAVLGTWPESQDLPAICTHLLTEYPNLLIVGVLPNAERAVKCRQAITTTELATGRLEDVLSEIRLEFSST